MLKRTFIAFVCLPEVVQCILYVVEMNTWSASCCVSACLLTRRPLINVIRMLAFSVLSIRSSVRSNACLACFVIDDVPL